MSSATTDQGFNETGHETVVAVFDTAAEADAAIRDLQAAHVSSSAISRQSGLSETGTTGTTATPGREKGFWERLFGAEPDRDADVYDRSMQSGGHVVTVRADESDIATIVSVLERHNPVDIDERAASYGLTEVSTTTTRPFASTTGAGVGAVGMGRAVDASDAETLHLSEERLVVGKRLVNRGGTRIRRFVVETPVEQDVTLHAETVVVERRPVTGATTTGTMAGQFTDKSIQMTEMAEEAVVGKTTHVVEEVSLRKQAAERTETVRDTVRKEDVEIETIPASTTTTGTTASTTTTAKPTGY